MGRTSSIDQLAPDILEQLQILLRDKRISQLEATQRINAILDERGEEVVSKSAVNRYSMKMEQVGAKLKQSREVAEMWIGKLGATPQGQVGHLVNEILRTLAFDLTIAVQGQEIDPDYAPEVAKMIKNMAIAMERLERAASENVKREEDIRKKTQQEAAETAAKIAKSGGMSKETVDLIKAGILGVKRGS